MHVYVSVVCVCTCVSVRVCACVSVCKCLCIYEHTPLLKDVSNSHSKQVLLGDRGKRETYPENGYVLKLLSVRPVHLLISLRQCECYALCSKVFKENSKLSSCNIVTTVYEGRQKECPYPNEPTKVLLWVRTHTSRQATNKVPLTTTFLFPRTKSNRRSAGVPCVFRDTRLEVEVVFLAVTAYDDRYHRSSECSSFGGTRPGSVVVHRVVVGRR